MPDTSSGQDKAKQVAQIFAQIQEAANNQDFQKADALREKLMEDPSALSETIKAAGIIEEAKSKGLDKDHLAIWKDLYENLTEEETNCFFYSLKSIVVPPKKRILAHGAYNNRLFLIDKGSVTVFYPKEEKNIVVAQLGRGDMLGEFTFTTISLCSASVASTSEVHLRYLDSTVADNWQDSQPALYTKLITFCQRNGKVDEILKNKELEKRTHPRFTVDGVASATILSKEGKKTSSGIKGSMSNISEVGCCFDINCSKREMARALLARHCHIIFEIKKAGEPLRIETIGKIVRVSFHLHNDYSVHVKFIKVIEKSVLEPISG